MVVVLILNFPRTGLACELVVNRVLTMVKIRATRAYIRDHPTIAYLCADISYLLGRVQIIKFRLILSKLLLITCYSFTCVFVKDQGVIQK